MPHYEVHSTSLTEIPEMDEYIARVFEAAKRDLREGRATVGEDVDGFIRGYFPLEIRHDDPEKPQAENLCAFLKKVGVRYLYGFYDGGNDDGMLEFHSAEINGERVDALKVYARIEGLLTPEDLRGIEADFPSGLPGAQNYDPLGEFIADLGAYFLGIKSWNGPVNIRGIFRFDVVTRQLVDIEQSRVEW